MSMPNVPGFRNNPESLADEWGKRSCPAPPTTNGVPTMSESFPDQLVASTTRTQGENCGNNEDRRDSYSGELLPDRQFQCTSTVPLEGLENCDHPLSAVAVMAKPAEFRAFRPHRDDYDHKGTHPIVGKLWANLIVSEF